MKNIKFGNLDYYFEAFRKYAIFKGRATRNEYWYFFLFNFIALMIVSFIEGKDVTTFSDIYSLVVFIPGLAVAVRRLHDVDKSGWFILIPIYNLILLIRRGKDEDNRFGPNPRGSAPLDNSEAVSSRDTSTQAQLPGNP